MRRPADAFFGPENAVNTIVDMRPQEYLRKDDEAAIGCVSGESGMLRRGSRTEYGRGSLLCMLTGG